MKIETVAGLACLVACCCADQAALAATDPKVVLNAVDDLHRSKSARGRMTMKIETANWSRTLHLEFWTKGKKRSLIRILAPQKEKGTSTLKIEKNMWNYLPKIKRTVKVPSSVMGGSWMGSHFTNDDLVKESRMADHFRCKIDFEGKRKGKQIVDLSCTALPDAPVIWGKIILEVDSDHIPSKILYFDEDNKLSRTMSFSKIKEIGGRRVPTLIRISPAEGTSEFTEIEYQEIEYDISLRNSLFTLRELRR